MDNYIHNNTNKYPEVGYLPVQNQVFYYATDEKTLVCHCSSKAPGSEKGTKRDAIKITYDLSGSSVRVIPNNHEHNCLIGQSLTLGSRASLNDDRLLDPEATEFAYAVSSDSSFFWSEAAERAPQKAVDDMDAGELQAYINKLKAAKQTKLEKAQAALAAL